MGTSSGFIGTAQAIGAQYGYGSIIGATLVGGIIELVLGFFIKPLKKLFPPIVTSLVIISIGLSLLPVGIKYFGGGAGAKDFGSLNHLLVGTTVIIVILIIIIMVMKLIMRLVINLSKSNYILMNYP